MKLLLCCVVFSSLALASTSASADQDTIQVSARLWLDTAGDSDLDFPEWQLPGLSTRPNNGICFVGGGNRAYTSEVGFLRGLNELGLLSSVKYMTGVSGGSWALSGFTYRQTNISDTEFLEPHTPTKNLDMATLARMPGELTMAHTVAAFSVLNISQASPAVQLFYKLLNPATVVPYLAGPHPGSENAWIDGIYELYLKPHGIPAHKYVTWDTAMANQIIARNPESNIDLSMFNFPRPGRSYPIITGVLMGPLSLAALAPNNVSNAFTGVEFTPIYSGVANPASRQFTNGQTTQTLDVGGYVENFAFNGTFVAPSDGSGATPTPAPWAGLGNISLAVESRKFSIEEMIGVSSMASASIYATQSAETRKFPTISAWDLVPRYHMFPLQSTDHPDTVMMLGDGGIIDNTGIISLLRRGVEYITVCDATSETLRNDTALTSLFGYQPDSPSMINDGEYHSYNQVFNLTDLDLFFNSIETALSQGKAGIATHTIYTVSNAWWGIDAGMEVHLTWIYVEMYKEWHDKLPSDTQASVDKKENGDFPNFPHYSTGPQFVLSPAQVNLLAALTADTVLDNVDAIKTAIGLGAKSKAKHGLTSSQIVAISLGAVVGLGVVLLIVKAVFSRRRQTINTRRHKAQLSNLLDMDDRS